MNGRGSRAVTGTAGGRAAGLAVAAWLAVVVTSGAQQLVMISEFMAGSQTNLADETGDYPDWIELYNYGTDTVSMAGWCLTDDAAALTKWRFPATNLNPRARLVVFASGKDRRIAGRELHTNFKLSDGGEYLALVRSDGLTRATEFSPAYPPQFPNVAYGFGMVYSNRVLLSTSAQARVSIPTASAYDPGWAAPAFDDSGWTAATNGVSFDAGAADPTESSFPAAAVAAAGPLVWFRFADDSASPVATNRGSLGASAHGLYLGNPRPGQPYGPSPTVGSFPGFESSNPCLMMGTPTNRVQVPRSTPLDFGTGPYSLTMWFSPSNATTRSDLLTIKGNTTDFGIHLSSVTAGKLSVYHSGFLGTGGTITNGGWYAVAVTREAGGLTTVYLNGSPLFATNDTRTMTITNDWLIGCNYSTYLTNVSSVFRGRIDEMAAYGRALTADEVAAEYRQAATNPTPYAALAPTDVQAAMYGSNATALVRMPFVWPGVTEFDRVALYMRYDDGFEAYVNGHAARSANSGGATNWNAAATARHADHLAVAPEGFDISSSASWLTTGTNLLAIRGLNASATNGDFLLQAQVSLDYAVLSTNQPGYLLQPTPGKMNPPSVGNLGPYIGEVTDGAPRPVGGEGSAPMAVTAAVTRTVHAISSVTLSYCFMYAAETNVGMTATNGLYIATIPTSPLGPGQMLRWRVTAIDSAGVTNVAPVRLDPVNYAVYFGTVAQNPAVTSSLPVFELFIDPAKAAAADSELGSRCAFFHDGEFYDNIAIEVRGNTTASLKKKSHRLEFNPGHHLRHPGPGGRIKKTSVMAEYCDPAYLRQHLSFWLLEQAGMPCAFFYPVWTTCNGTNYQFGYHTDVVGDEMLERLGYDPEGALYKATGTVQTNHFSTGGFQKKTRTWEAGTADFDAMAFSIGEYRTLDQRRAALFDRINLPEVINYLACVRFTQEADDVWANMCLYRDSDGSGEWSVIPFDLNLSWGQCYYGDATAVYYQITATNDFYKSHPLYGGSQVRQGGTANYNRLYDAIIAVPETRDMLLRRMRTVMDRWIQSPDTPEGSRVVEAHIAEMTNSFSTEAMADRALWGWPPNAGPYGWGTNLWLADGVQGLVTNYLALRRQHFFGTHCITNAAAMAVGLGYTNCAGIPVSQPADAGLRIVGVEPNPASGNALQEYLVVSNVNGFALDVSGWRVAGGVGLTFRPGTVIPSNGVLYVARDSAAFRARTSGPAGGQSLFVQGGYDGQLSARGEALYLLNEAGVTNDAFTYAGVPTAAQDALRITEIMYHPAPPTAAESVAAPGAEADDYAFIEVANTGAADLDAGGASLAKGVEFTFPSNLVLHAGQRVVVAANPTAFAARYGAAATNVIGAWFGGLDHGGETVQLLDPAGENVLEFDYDDAWYPLTDGLGFSLVIRDESAPWDTWGLKESWRASGDPGGSPGAADPAPAVLPAVRINEALAHTDLPDLDAIELWNDGDTDAAIGGWWLTDDFGEPFKFRIPPGTTVPAGGYLLYTATDFDPSPGVPPSFNLSATGEEVWVFSAGAATNLTGWYHGFRFGPTQNGVSLGRYVTSAGDEHLVAASANTLGASNAYPRVGPVVISEIMYHPADLGTNDNARDEFIELANFGATPASLFDPLAPTNTWRLREAVSYDFPTNVTLAAGGRLLVVGFDPVADPASAAAFFSAYGLDTNTVLYGPWSGKLDNSADRIELLRPDNPDPGLVPYILVEAVDYRDAEPWPAAADGAGKSLHRIALGSYGNDAINWYAADPTPTAAAALDADFDSDGQPDWAEWRARTDRGSAASRLAVEGRVEATAGGIVVHWQSIAGMYYAIERSTNLVGGCFELLQSRIPGLPSLTTWTDTTHRATFNTYRVRLDAQ